MRRNIFDANQEIPERVDKPIPKVGEITNPELCPRCWTRLSLFESESGEFRWYCFTCESPYWSPIK